VRECHNLSPSVRLNRPASPNLSDPNELATSRHLIVIASPPNKVTTPYFVVTVAAEIEYRKPMKFTQHILTSSRSSPIILLISLLSFELSAVESARVTLVHAPDGGIQPQAAVDGQGVIHLIYFKGDDRGGDIFYVRQESGKETFSKPIQVNGQPGSAIAAGTIRGAQLAVGKNGRVHVVWTGGKGAVRPTIEGKEVNPVLYTRLNDEGTAFEPERNLKNSASPSDGDTVAADRDGNVYAAWHALTPGATNEVGRAVYVTRSMDEGKTFQDEARATSKPTGACGCCGLRAFADSSGTVYILFRAASENVNRDEILLVSRRPGAEFQIVNAHPWKAATCPMSSAGLTEGKNQVLAAWETADQVYFATVDPKTLRVSKANAPPGSAKRKHPIAVANGKGETLFAWTEGTGWAKGGAVAWQLYDKAGNPTSEKGNVEGVPAWSLVTAFPKSDGDFVIVY